MMFKVFVPVYERTGERTISGAPYWSVEFVSNLVVEAPNMQAAIAIAKARGVAAPVLAEADGATGPTLTH